MEKRIKNSPLWVYEEINRYDCENYLQSYLFTGDRDPIPNLLDTVGGSVVHYPDYHPPCCPPSPFGMKNSFLSLLEVLAGWQFSPEPLS